MIATVESESGLLAAEGRNYGWNGTNVTNFREHLLHLFEEVYKVVLLLEDLDKSGLMSDDQFQRGSIDWFASKAIVSPS